MTSLIVAMALLLSTPAVASPQAVDGHPECKELEQAVAPAVAAGSSQTVDAILAAASAAGRNTCVGLVLSQLAGIALTSRRTADTERLAERSIKALEIDHAPGDPILLRPLHLLALARFELGQTARARQATQKMLEISTNRPQDLAMVHNMTAILLEHEGRLREAEAARLAAIRAHEEAHLSGSADYAVMVGTLGMLYTKLQRYPEAAAALDRAAAILDAAPDAAQTDRIHLLLLRATLQGWQGQWRDAETKFRRALEMTDRLPYAEPRLVRQILTGYAVALRKTRQPREARTIEARAAALPGGTAANSLVDITELRQKKPKR